MSYVASPDPLAPEFAMDDGQQMEQDLPVPAVNNIDPEEDADAEPGADPLSDDSSEEDEEAERRVREGFIVDEDEEEEEDERRRRRKRRKHKHRRREFFSSGGLQIHLKQLC